MQTLPETSIQFLAQAVYYMPRHARIDFSSQLNEPSVDAQFSGFPCQVKRVDWNAVTTESRPGVKRHVSKRLGPGRIHHLENVDAERGEDHFQFVYQSDIDSAEDIFRQLHRLRRFRR